MLLFSRIFSLSRGSIIKISITLLFTSLMLGLSTGNAASIPVDKYSTYLKTAQKTPMSPY
jgi:hypothetical protein